MKQKRNKLMKLVGWIFFLFALAFFCLQMGYLFVHSRYQVEYIDNRLFYIINIFCVLCLIVAIFILLTLTKKIRIALSSVALLFIIVNTWLLIKSNQQIKNITSISPDWVQVFSIKEDVASGEAMYYRSYYGILGRAKERLSFYPQEEVKLEWLANDIAAVTYKAEDQTLQQFIATYGDRGSGRSYYYVGAEMHGSWQADDSKVISDTEGISIIENGKTEWFPWDNIVQFGTLAVVLMKNSEAAWTIALDENFEVHSEALVPTTGNIILYKATMEQTDPIVLRCEDEY
ncbi:hypothetical protein OEV98_12620 [Caldibacillus lycopersici]|uniref:Uncharacterized protein n=1 Tax=Perspicuibacillus lycopersici TaxID=1325689 RepID=A0AAE3LN75_9BACI|nr:hypothetical protein [Perspicuibacillus lycopersici]MCU9614380.1 hypothetical protein [Perspicuibacillus lycopersici]